MQDACLVCLLTVIHQSAMQMISTLDSQDCGTSSTTQ